MYVSIALRVIISFSMLMLAVQHQIAFSIPVDLVLINNAFFEE